MPIFWQFFAGTALQASEIEDEFRIKMNSTHHT
jgi:hypothetical protein